MTEVKVYSFCEKDYVATKFSVEETIELFNKKRGTSHTIEDVREVDLDNEHTRVWITPSDRKILTFREAIDFYGEFERPYLIASTYFYDRK